MILYSKLNCKFRLGGKYLENEDIWLMRKAGCLRKGREKEKRNVNLLNLECGWDWMTICSFTGLPLSLSVNNREWLHCLCI